MLHPVRRRRRGRPRRRRIKPVRSGYFSGASAAAFWRGGGGSERKARGGTMWEFFGEAEIGEDNVSVGANKDILGFQVAVYDACGVQAVDAFDLIAGVSARNGK